MTPDDPNRQTRAVTDIKPGTSLLDAAVGAASDDTSRYTLPSPGPAQTKTFAHVSYKRLTRRVVIAAGVLVALMLALIGTAWVLQRGQQNPDGQYAGRLGALKDQDVELKQQVTELPRSEFALRDGISTLVVSGDLALTQQLRLQPTDLPDSAALGTLLVDKATNTLQFYDGSKFVSLGATVVQIQNQTGVTSIQGITGDVRFVGSDGVAVSQVGGTITIGGAALSLPQPLSATDSPSFAGLTVAGKQVGDVLQGGNSFGTAMTIGTNDGQDVNFEVGGNVVMRLSAAGDALFQSSTYSDTALLVRDPGNTVLFRVDTNARRIYVGSSVGHAVGVPFVLNSRTTAGDPFGVAGSMYYNAISGRFRCYEAGTWKDCISAGGGLGTGDILQGGNSFGQAMIIGTNDAQALNFETGGTTRMTVDGTTGNVGIGANPHATHKFLIGGSAFVNGNLFSNDGVYADRRFIFGNSIAGGKRIQHAGNDIEVVAGDLVRLHVDGDAGNIGINNTSPGNLLSINTPTTVDSAAQVLISTGGTTNKGLAIQATSGQTSHLLQLQNHNGLAVSGFDGSAKLYVGTGGGALASNIVLSINTIGTGNIGQVIKGVNGQTADLLQLWDTTLAVLAGFNATGNLFIGTTAAPNKITVNTATTPDAAAQVLISTGAAGNTGLVVQGVVTQTADLLQIQNSGGVTVARMTAGGSFTTTGVIAAGTMSALTSGGNTARLSFVTQDAVSLGQIIRGVGGQSGDLLQLQNSGGTVLSGFNGTGNLFIGTTAAPNKINVNTATTPDATAQVLISTGSAGNRGLVVQGVSGQTGHLLQLQNDSGTATSGFTGAGRLFVNAPAPFSATTFSLRAGGTSNIGLAIRAGTSQTGDLLQLQDNGGAALSGFNASGRLYYADSGFTVTLNTATLTGNAVVSLPNTAGVNDTVCLQLLGNCGGGVGGGTGDINQGGNIFSQTMVIGTLDGYGINLAVGGTTVMSFGTAGNVTLQNSTNSNVAFVVQNASGAVMFRVDTVENRVRMGNPNDGIVMRLVLDNSPSPGDPTGINGSMYYNSVSDRFRCYQAGAWKDCDSPELLATKSADQTISGTSYEDVADLSYPVVASGRYNLRCSLTVSVTGNGGYISMAGPASPTRYTASFLKPSDQSSGEQFAASTTYDDPSNTLGFRVTTTSWGSNRFRIEYSAELINDANAGDWKLRARAETGSSITIYDYSNCNLRAF